jgi:hypothetical protein
MPALEIIPGYDFDAKEVPTRQKLLRQAQDLQIYNIPLSSVAATILSMVFGDVSNTSGATPPGEGWIWVSPAGDRYFGGVERASRLWQAQGGWESDRFYTVPDGPANDNSTEEGEIVASATPENFEHRTTSMNTDDIPLAALSQAMESGYTRARLCFRGGCQFFVGGQASLANYHSDLVGAHSLVNTGMTVNEIDNGGRKGYFCYVIDRNNSGNLTPASFSWLPGIISRGEGSV